MCSVLRLLFAKGPLLQHINYLTVGVAQSVVDGYSLSLSHSHSLSRIQRLSLRSYRNCFFRGHWPSYCIKTKLTRFGLVAELAGKPMIAQ